MTLFIFKYCLPTLLGYTLFVGIAGRLNPFRKPFYPEERPSWLLGLWTGLTVLLVLSVGLHMAYGMSLEGARSLAKPSAWFMAALLIPGFITYLIYRRRVNASSATAIAPSFDWSMQENDEEFAASLNNAVANRDEDDPLDTDLDPSSLDDMEIPEDEGPVIAAFLDTADLGTVDTRELPEPVNDAADITTDDTSAFDTDDGDNSGNDELHPSTAENTSAVDAVNASDADTDELDMTQFVPSDNIAELVADSSEPVTTGQVTNEQVIDDVVPPSTPSENSGAEHTDSADESIRVEADTTHDIDAADVAPTDATPEENLAAEASLAAMAAAQQEAQDLMKEQSSEIAALQQALQHENTLRQETEKHLRITRKALATMESETRDYESRKADSIIALEDQLAQSITLQSEFERLATTEKSRRIDLETTVVHLKQDLVKVKHDVRRSIAARAKALSTANKSIAFARQAVQTRARLESELEAAQQALDNRQATVSSLIRALEDEKGRTEDDIASLAKQYVLREKQMQARKSLEQVARSVENKLSTRLVKKVAKARPAMTDAKD